MQLLKEKAPVKDFEEQFPVTRNTAASKIRHFVAMVTPMSLQPLIITKFHLYLIQLRCQFFQIFVYGNVAYAQT